MNHPTSQRWDIFCRVIDNFGDIGVSWRLALQLAAGHGVAVRLWVDQLAVLHALCPQVDDTAARQTISGVEVFRYDPRDTAAEFPPPAAVVIGAFGCGLPPRYVAAMAACRIKPLWIVLEYLSAEPWVRTHHGLPSPHPQYGLPRHFFFPGVTEGTGGVLREADLLARRDAFDASARQRWWAQLGFDAVPPQALTVSLFAYPHAPYADLIEACALGATPVVMVIPAGPLALCVRDHLGAGTVESVRAGQLELRFVPFVPQAQYDSLLWTCDVNFVRGEDTFVRAQWAGRPFVWHIYPQAGNAHVAKLDAFLAQFSAGLAVPVAQPVRGLWQAWNGVAGAPRLGGAWQAFNAELAAQRQGLQHWQDQLARVGDLAGNLLSFCRKML
jgi:uncharacterized repeat protein (TIGR03837 family)